MSDLRKKCIGFTIQPWQEEKLPVACCQRTSNFRSKDDKPPMDERAEFQAGGREYQKKEELNITLVINASSRKLIIAVSRKCKASIIDVVVADEHFITDCLRR
jgi:hypothetical protein